MVKVLIKKLDPTVQLPEYKTSGASGMDLTAFTEKPINVKPKTCLLYTSPSPRDGLLSRMPSSA